MFKKKKKHFFGIFSTGGRNSQKKLPKLKIWKKKKAPFLEKCLNMIFKQFWAFWTHIFFSLWQNFFYHESDFLLFSQKTKQNKTKQKQKKKKKKKHF